MVINKSVRLEYGAAVTYLNVMVLPAYLGVTELF
jgi:hypothetical protein